MSARAGWVDNIISSLEHTTFEYCFKSHEAIITAFNFSNTFLENEYYWNIVFQETMDQETRHDQKLWGRCGDTGQLY